ncbi:uncharacterized protein AB675_1115 [Cyphellophora attinorum]|uniref:Uncharacterized protein n=1 Tax=Cyphellophora attinorum TaxID=1664694 RepID=A0A0N1HR63_9EURO|nr:uncharacterized protein AB675_1115 [Phialophora attinorum]KPI38174.1 hypothetical protein AB675_1115 [Phialophora attinorum]
MAIYQYPQVPRASQTQPQRQAAENISHQSDNRFSFLPTPAEARGYSWNSSEADPRHSHVPPLPQLPAQLSSQQQEPLHNNANVAQPAPDFTLINNPSSQAVEISPAPTYYSHYPEAQAGPQLYTGQPSETSSYAPADSTYSAACSTSHLHESHPAPPTVPYDIKTDNMHYTQMPAQSSQATQSQQQHAPPPIGPDTNPLAPTTPTRVHLNRESTTTNMAVLNPPSATYPVSATNFSPLPQPERGGTWHTSLFSCASPSVCLTSLFCPCVTYGRTQYRLSRRSAKSDPTNFLGFNLAAIRAVSHLAYYAGSMLFWPPCRRRESGRRTGWSRSKGLGAYWMICGRVYVAVVVV